MPRQTFHNLGKGQDYPSSNTHEVDCTQCHLQRLPPRSRLWFISPHLPQTIIPGMEGRLILKVVLCVTSRETGLT